MSRKPSLTCKDTLYEKENGQFLKTKYEHILKHREEKAHGGYMIVTNGCNMLTEQRLIGYGSQLCHGPLGKMMHDAKRNKESRFICALHEWNRTSEFMSILGNLFEAELRKYGPDHTCEGDEIDGISRVQKKIIYLCISCSRMSTFFSRGIQ